MYIFDCIPVCVDAVSLLTTIAQKRHTSHQVTTMLATSKNVLTGAPAIIKVSGHQYQWLAGGYDLTIGHFQKWLAWWSPGE